MTSFLGSTRYALARLHRFSGRDPKSVFWPYAGAVIAIGALAIVLVMIPAMLSFQQRAEAIALEQPEQVSVTASATGYSLSVSGDHPELAAILGSTLSGIGGVAVLVVTALAAAVTRRLHDSGLSGWLGLIPLPLFALSLGLMSKALALSNAPSEAEASTFLLTFACTFFYNATVVLLAVLLCRKSTAGANRYGADARDLASGGRSA